MLFKCICEKLNLRKRNPITIQFDLTKEVQDVINNGLSTLDAAVNTIDDSYSLAICGYALALGKRYGKLATISNRLELKANINGEIHVFHLYFSNIKFDK